jgi:hypothetical protein
MAKKRIDKSELERCDLFCEQDYPRFYDEKEVRKKLKDKLIKGNISLRKQFPQISPLTNKDISEIFDREKRNQPKFCKKIYCNPKCDRNKPTRYVDDLAVKNFNHLKKRGAITACRPDRYAKFVKKLKPLSKTKKSVTFKNLIKFI